MTSETVLSGQMLAATINGLSPGVYNVRIKSRNGNGDSEFGPEALFSAGKYVLYVHSFKSLTIPVLWIVKLHCFLSALQNFYIAAAPPLTIEGPGLPVQEGTAAILNCTYQDGSTPRNVEWSRTGASLPPDAITLESVLILPNVKTDYSGGFSCQVDKMSTSFLLEVRSVTGTSSVTGTQSQTLLLVGVLAPAVAIIILVLAICGVCLIWKSRRGKRRDHVDFVMTNNAAGDVNNKAVHVRH